MIVAYLPSFPFRGQSAPYLWVFYKLLTTYGNQLHFLIGDEYRYDLDTWRQEDRWELLDDSQKRQGYRLPTEVELAQVSYTPFNSDFLERKLLINNGNATSAFRQYLSENDAGLEHDFTIALEGLNAADVILNWCNCPSLSDACGRLSIPVMNMELGPLRHPEYLSTAYLDFKGVNGNTEAAERYLDAQDECHLNLSMDDLRQFFAVNTPPELTHQYNLGIVMQVENDSNLIAFANDFSNQALLDHAKLYYGSDFVVRGHPGSAFKLNENQHNVDISDSSIEFIAKCNNILTINSSVGLEALLLEIPVEAKGDSSFSYILATNDKQERINRLGFYLFAYLVPYPLIFDLDYVRFRLDKPSESEIIQRHIKFYECAGDTNER